MFRWFFASLRILCYFDLFMDNRLLAFDLNQGPIPKETCVDYGEGDRIDRYLYPVIFHLEVVTCFVLQLNLNLKVAYVRWALYTFDACSRLHCHSN